MNYGTTGAVKIEVDARAGNGAVKKHRRAERAVNSGRD